MRVFITLFLGLGAATASAAPVDFNRQVRPILAKACFTCHGPDAKKRKADFRLDQKSGSQKAAEILKRITTNDSELRMPPASSKLSLTQLETVILKKWIADGAPYSAHWAFVAPRRPSLPAVRSRHWPRTAIDHFILSRLEREQLSPSPTATRRQLIRRLSLDLCGLPPTPHEVAQFLADKRPDAYERVVDRLLASPRFGERLSLHWLDAARYADTHGYHEDYHRDLWPWRSWVIRAFNTNMPFDQFTVEQLAGDLLKKPTVNQLIATGFNRNHGVTASGISEEYRVEYVLDRVKTTSTVWLGLTMQCAQCHDHKYDPISQRDFYRFFAFFNSVTDKGVENRTGNVDPLIKVSTAQTQTALRRIQRRIQQLTSQLNDRRSKARSSLDKWVAAARANGTRASATTRGLRLHLPLDQLKDGSPLDATGKPLGRVYGAPRLAAGKFGQALAFDGRTHVDLGQRGPFDRTDAFSYGAWVKGGSGGAIIAKMDDSRQYRGWDMYISGRQLEVHLIHQWPTNAIHMKTKASLPKDWVHLFVTYDGSSKAKGLRIYFNGRQQEVNVTRDQLTKTIKTGKPLHVGRRNPSGFYKGLVDDVRIYDRALSANEVAGLANYDPIGSILKVARSKRSKPQQTKLIDFFLEQKDKDYQRLSKRLTALQAELNKTKAVSGKMTTMVMKDLPAPRKTFILKRGAYDQHGEQVTTGTPGFLPTPVRGNTNRLALARWLVGRDHPLTSRVTINRLWQLVFGLGIVETSEDFGTQGSPPSHPRLLDWLAVEFRDTRWDIKRMLKMIVMSATYRQSAKVSRERLKRDPKNRLLARGPRFRLAAETIRDNALAVSGLLVERLGGPSVKTYQPKGLWLETSNRPYVQDHGARLFRRSLYMYWKRSVPPPNMFAIDAPTREVCLVRRQRTNTPLMALVILNDRTFVEAARALAERALKHARPDQRIEYLFQRVLSRPPTGKEAAIVQRILDRQRALYQQNRTAAQKLLDVGESPRDKSLDASEHAAWTMISSMLLNLDETITKE